MDELSPGDLFSSEVDMTAALEDSIRADIRLYVIEVGREPLLSGEEEVILGHLIQDGQAARQLIDNDSPTKQERAELEIIKALGDEAWERMVKANLRLVISIAKDFDKSNMSLLDAIQEGSLGLFRAAERFDPSHGMKFSTYAYDWIWGAINRAGIKKNRIIRLPEHIYYAVAKLSRIENQYDNDTGEKPSIDVVAKEMELPIDEVKQLRLMKDPISLEAWLENNSLLEDGADAQGKIIPLVDRRVLDENEVSNEEFNAALPNLTSRQEEILRRLVGLEQPRQSIEEIADDLGIQSASVEKVIANALKRSGIFLPDARRKRK